MPEPKTGGLKGKGPLGIPKWGWIAILLAGVGLFIYLRRKSASSTSASTTPPVGGTGVDSSQLASDIAAQLAASLGGTPAATDPNATGGMDWASFLDSLAAQQQAYLTQLESYISSLAAAGLGAPGTPQTAPSTPPPTTPPPPGTPAPGASPGFPTSGGPAVYQTSSGQVTVAGLFGPTDILGLPSSYTNVNYQPGGGQTTYAFSKTPGQQILAPKPGSPVYL